MAAGSQPNLQRVLALLSESEINAGVESFWDSGFTVWLGLTFRPEMGDGHQVAGGGSRLAR
jgi:hypothetical protein